MEGKQVLVKSVDNLFSTELLTEGAPAFSILRATFKNGSSKNVVLLKKQ